MRLARLTGARVELEGVDDAALIAAAMDARQGGVQLTLTEWEGFSEREREAWSEAGRRLAALADWQRAKVIGNPRAQAALLGQADDELGREAVEELELLAGLDGIVEQYLACDVVV